MLVIVDESNAEEFEKKCNNLMSEGYKISSTSCGFVDSEEYGFASVYQAILVKKEV